MQLAVKAQSNCRATAEALDLMQNPPTVFARQANIAIGPQQVNNGVPTPALPSRARNHETEPNTFWSSTADGWSPERRA